jgi:hypothetical protein
VRGCATNSYKILCSLANALGAVDHRTKGENVARIIALHRWIPLALATGLWGCRPTGTSSLPPPSAVQPLPVRYPDLLRGANIEGVVILDIARDSLGHYDVQRSHVVYQTHETFLVAVRNAVDSAARVPALYGNRRSAAVSRDTFTFILRRDSSACPEAKPHWTPVCSMRDRPRRSVVP